MKVMKKEENENNEMKYVMKMKEMKWTMK